MLVVDNEMGYLYPIDIKTTNVKTTNWISMFWKLRYDFQASFYTMGLFLGNYCQKYNCTVFKPFKFIVESQTSPGTPLVFEAGHEIIDFGRFGGKMVSKEYEGFDQAIRRFTWHSENDLWDYPMEDYINEGLRLITLPKLDNGK